MNDEQILKPQRRTRSPDRHPQVTIRFFIAVLHSHLAPMTLAISPIPLSSGCSSLTEGRWSAEKNMNAFNALLGALGSCTIHQRVRGYLRGGKGLIEIRYLSTPHFACFSRLKSTKIPFIQPFSLHQPPPRESVGVSKGTNIAGLEMWQSGTEERTPQHTFFFLGGFLAFPSSASAFFCFLGECFSDLSFFSCACAG